MLSWEYPPRVIGGLARVVAELSKQMARQGWEVHVVTADHPGTPEHEIDNGVHVHRVKTQTDWTPDFLTWVSRLNYGMLQYAIELHTKTPFSVIHAHDWMVADAAWVMKQGFHVPVVSTIHATEAGRMHGLHTDMQRYIGQIEWRLTFESWKVIVNSKHMLSELQNQFKTPVDKIAVIPNGIDPDIFDFEFDPSPLRRQYAKNSDQIVLYVGRMVREKGVQVLLHAAQSILGAAPGTQFLMVGTGYYLDELKWLAAHLNVAQNVHFLGYVSDPDLLRLYKIADVVVTPSLYEPFGIVALEGMAAHVPVVTSDAGGLTDFVEHLQNGITTYAGDAGSLAWGVMEVLRNKDLAERLRREAYDRVRNIYNWKIIAKRTLEVYDKVIAEAQAAGFMSGQSKAEPRKTAAPAAATKGISEK
jgi:glycosyltransferase involved in cell wall biosynthesis